MFTGRGDTRTDGTAQGQRLRNIPFTTPVHRAHGVFIVRNFFAFSDASGFHVARIESSVNKDSPLLAIGPHMTEKPTLHRQDQPKEQPIQQPIQIGPRHGYRIEGDHAFITADLQIPPHRSGGEWTLELWATELPYRKGPLTGVKIAQIALELPAQIGPHTYQVDSWAAARFPLQGRAHAMSLVLIQHGPDVQTSVHAFANYAEPETFTAPHFEGTVGYRIVGNEVLLQADAITNPRPEGNLSGTLSVELWAFPLSGASTEGLRLAASALDRVGGQFRLPEIESRVAFDEPPAGRYQLALLLSEWTLSHDFVARDRRDFASIYEVSAPELAVSPRVTPRAKGKPPARTADRLRLVPAAEPAAERDAAPPAVAPRLVSIQTASVEALAKVKGLNLKIAQEIVKARPFASLEDLVRVRGLGAKTVARLKALVTL